MVSTCMRAEECGGGRAWRCNLASVVRACVEKQSGERRGGSSMELFVGVTCLIRQGGVGV